MSLRNLRVLRHSLWGRRLDWQNKARCIFSFAMAIEGEGETSYHHIYEK